jgi:hypothetical protein
MRHHMRIKLGAFWSGLPQPGASPAPFNLPAQGGPYFRTPFGLILLLVSLLHATALTAASHDGPPSIRALFDEALSQAGRVENLAARVSILEEAGTGLRMADGDLVRKLLSSTYATIVEAPDILSSSSAPAKDAAALPSRDKPTYDRDDVFRRFMAVVARFDPQLAATYMSSYSRKHKESSAAKHGWAAAYDLLGDDRAGSIRFATAAAQGGDFTDVALLYLERLRPLEPEAADSIARIVIRSASVLSPNARLLLAAYVLPHPRVPQIVASRLVTREILDRPSVLGVLPSPSLVHQLARGLVANSQSMNTQQLMALRLVEESLHSSYPSLATVIQQERVRLGRLVAPEVIQTIDGEVLRWYSATDELQHSIEMSESAFRSSGNAMYRDRANTLRALSLARSGDYGSALSLVGPLPVGARENARDAVLLYAVNAVNDYERASRLATIARADTHNQFVVGYTLLTAARLASAQASPPEEQIAAMLEEVSQLAQHLRNPAERFSLRLGAAVLWSRHDPARAYIDLAAILRDLPSGNIADGIPFVQFVLRVGGTALEFNLPAGHSTLYNLVRRLAIHDIQRTTAILSTAATEEVRLRCVIAAAAEYLAHEQRKASSRR